MRAMWFVLLRTRQIRVNTWITAFLGAVNKEVRRAMIYILFFSYQGIMTWIQISSSEGSSCLAPGRVALAIVIEAKTKRAIKVNFMLRKRIMLSNKQEMGLYLYEAWIYPLFRLKPSMPCDAGGCLIHDTLVTKIVYINTNGIMLHCIAE